MRRADWLTLPLISACVLAAFPSMAQQSSPPVFKVANTPTNEEVAPSAFGTLQGQARLLGQSESLGIQVSLQSRQAAAGPVAYTNRDGWFRISHVPTGTYAVTFSKPPYAPQTVRNVTVIEDLENALEPMTLSWDHPLELGVNSGRRIYANPVMPWAGTIGAEGLRVLALGKGIAPVYVAPKVNPAGLSWSPDGQKLAFVDLKQEGALTLLDFRHPQSPAWQHGAIALADEERVAWGPASDRVAYRKSETDFDVLTTAGASRSLSLPQGLKFKTSCQMQFSPDGQSVAFIGQASNGNGLYRYSLEVPSVVKLFDFGDNCGNVIAFSLDGSKVYCTVPVDAGSVLDFCAVPNGSRMADSILLFEGVSLQVALSREQRYLAYYSRDPATQLPCVAIANLATKQHQNVGLGGDGELHLSDQVWLPDHAALLYSTDFDTRMVDLKAGINLP